MPYAISRGTIRRRR
ncbi:hypothetical protein GQ600_14141 [Phytophthora cactorum]|nr:hypothetical protein GQ600_14141 [Phytophthora cactorum]